MLSLPEAYWRRVLAIQTDQTSSTPAYSQDGGHGGFPDIIVNLTGPPNGPAT